MERQALKTLADAELYGSGIATSWPSTPWASAAALSRRSTPWRHHARFSVTIGHAPSEAKSAASWRLVVGRVAGSRKARERLGKLLDKLEGKD
jgi:hypothetical protein